MVVRLPHLPFVNSIFLRLLDFSSILVRIFSSQQLIHGLHCNQWLQDDPMPSVISHGIHGLKKRIAFIHQSSWTTYFIQHTRYSYTSSSSPSNRSMSTTMDSDTDVDHPLHVLFFPLMAPGHMSPMVDTAKLFASRGVKTTILTTPANAPLILPSISNSKITLSLIPFPSAAVGLPDGCENFSSVPLISQQPLFLQAVPMLRRPFDQILTDLHPDCVVTDTFLPWTQTIAADHNIPRLVFHVTGFFSLCASDSVARHGIPTEEDGNDSIVLPGLPHRVEMLRQQIPDWSDARSIFHDLMTQVTEHEPKSYGVVVNSFYELEPDYAKHYREVVGRRAWHIGPVSLCSKVPDEMRNRGSKASIDWKYCSDWLETRAKSSVVYVCFGSLSDVPAVQLREIALGLEASGHPFIWAVKTTEKDDGDGWIPDGGYEERIEGRGMVIRGWAPQIMILDHPAVGGFVTHCGWNSTLEGVTAGLPMATWPLSSEQFYNERVVVDLLGIGVAVGLDKHAELPEEREVVAAERVEAAVRRLMGGGEEAEERRRRARELGEMARTAVEEGGSSYVDLENLIQELLLLRANKP